MSDEKKKVVIKDKEAEGTELYYDPEYKLSIEFHNCNECPVNIIQKGQPPEPPKPPKP